MHQTLEYRKPVASADFTHWNHHHQDLALARGLTQSATLLWEYLIEQGFSGKDELIDLREFNKWVSKRRAPFDRRTIKAALQRLLDEHLLVCRKKASEFFGKYFVKPLGALLRPIKRCKPKAPIATFEASNPQFLDEPELTTTTSLDSDKAELLEAAGLTFAPGDDKWMQCFSLAEVARAILYFLENRPQQLRNPLGWFRRCLEDGWGDRLDNFFCPAESDVNLFIKLTERLKGILEDSPD